VRIGRRRVWDEGDGEMGEENGQTKKNRS